MIKSQRNNIERDKLIESGKQMWNQKIAKNSNWGRMNLYRDIYYKYIKDSSNVKMIQET